MGVYVITFKFIYLFFNDFRNPKMWLLRILLHIQFSTEVALW